VLERGIALAFMPPATALSDMVEIDIRGTAVAAEVVRPPFQKLAAEVAATAGAAGATADTATAATAATALRPTAP
jgi:hypothetical protein